MKRAGARERASPAQGRLRCLDLDAAGDIHLRCNARGGWYHITTRGVGRREIFEDDRDREHFVELVGELAVRYGVVLHAYVLMGNHYHVLIETPEGNASRALQWMNVSYANWFNARHGRSGQFFQGRYRSIPVDGEGAWALTCSVYLQDRKSVV